MIKLQGRPLTRAGNVGMPLDSMADGPSKNNSVRSLYSHSVIFDSFSQPLLSCLRLSVNLGRTCPNE
jgi:hypothetical protein